MRVLAAEFVTSAVDRNGIPADGIPHIALVGRSNVGKSTLVNALAGRAIARTSAAPGKTRLANLYRVTVEGGPGGPGRWTTYFADLPGYGYARGGRESVTELRKIADAYFEIEEVEGKTRRVEENKLKSSSIPSRRPSIPSRYEIAGVLHLIDARHPGLDADQEAHDWLASLGVERAVVATKIDKLSRAERARNLEELKRRFGTAVVPVSAVRGEGLDDLWKLITQMARPTLRPR
jgi:GTP-binding protein